MTAKRGKTDGFATSPEFIKTLLDTSVMQLRPENNITYVASRNDKVIDVWKGLNRHHFLSVPVLNEKEMYRGFIDLGEIVGFFANYFGQHVIRTYPTLHQLIEADKEFLKQTVDNMMVTPSRTRVAFMPVKNNMSLLHCMEILAKEPEVERIPIVNANGVLWNFLTQSHVLDYLSKNFDKIGTKKNKPISQFHDAFKTIPKISQDQLAYDAFIMMNQQKVHSLAVVDEKQHLVGAISVRDLKLVMEDKIFSYLLEPVQTFIQRLNEDKTDRPKEVVTLKPTDTLQGAIELLVRNKLHRVFVIDDKKHVTGIVGLKEVLHEIITE